MARKMATCNRVAESPEYSMAIRDDREITHGPAGSLLEQLLFIVNGTNRIRRNLQICLTAGRISFRIMRYPSATECFIDTGRLSQRLEPFLPLSPETELRYLRESHGRILRAFIDQHATQKWRIE